MNKTGIVILLNGLSASGKTTLGQKLVTYLQSRGLPAFLMDGDFVRDFFGNDLGFSKEDRITACKRVAFGTKLLIDNGTNVVLAVVMGQRELRAFYKSKFDFVEIFLNADVADCIKNDPRGTYAKNLKLEKPNMTGVDLPFNAPDTPDLTIYPYKESPDESFRRIISFLEGKKVLI